MNQERVLKALERIKARTYGGSSICDSWVYHTLPFEGLPHIQSHRGMTMDRWNHIMGSSGIDFDGKSVADFGCSVGAFSLLIARDTEATKVTGYDYDPDSLEVAKVLAEELGLAEKTSFVHTTIDQDFLKNLSHYDIIIWMSQWMWIVKQHGLDVGKDMLFEVGRHTDTLLFESAANDAAAKIEGTTQETIKEWLFECTAFSDIRDIGFTPGWHGDRHIHICSKPEYELSGNRSKIERISRDVVRKTYTPEDKWMVDREEICLKRLEAYRNFPKFVGKTENTVDISYCGRVQPCNDLWDFEDQKRDILRALEDCRITHRDVKPKNVLRLNGIMYLVDFGWALLDDETDESVPTPPTLGGQRYEGHKWDDAHAMGLL